MEFIIFCLFIVVIFLFINFFKYKKDLEDVLTDLTYHVELLRINQDDYNSKVNKTFNVKNR